MVSPTNHSTSWYYIYLLQRVWVFCSWDFRVNSARNCDLPVLMALSGSKRNLYDDLALNRQRREIRVLILCEGNDNSPVECFMKTISLDSRDTSFNALSYVWGNANDTTNILVNQFLVSVSKSRAKCLQSLRDNTANHAQLLDPNTLGYMGRRSLH